MHLVQTHIAERQATFSHHAFFAHLASSASLHEVTAFAPRLAFWVMSFQDVLRLNEQLVREPAVRRIIRHHRVEDAGHERWFLEDVAKLGLPAVDIGSLFGKHHAATRDAAYALVSEVFRVTDDRLRVVLLLTIESAGHIFFDRIARRVEEAGMTGHLRYFSFSHLEIEKRHQVFENEIERQIAAMVLPPALRKQAFEMVDRCYDAFGAMFDGLVDAIETPQLEAGAA